MKIQRKYRYRIYHGDCIKVLDELIAQKTVVDCVIVDPPYGMTKCKWDTPLDWGIIWRKLDCICKPKAVICIFSKQPYTSIINQSNMKEFRYELIWKKTQHTAPMLSKTRILPIHENISVFYKKQGCYNPQFSYGHTNYSATKSTTKYGNRLYGQVYSMHRDCQDGSRYPTSVLTYKNARGGLHPTQKPLELIEYLVRTYTNKNDLVLDFTMGSGTTGIACLNTGRRFLGIELDNSMYNIAKNRLSSQEEL